MFSISRTTPILLLFCIGAFFVSCASPPPLSPSATFTHAKFVKNVATEPMMSLAMDQNGRFIIGRADQGIEIMGIKGDKHVKLPATDKHGRQILKEPSDIAVYEDTIYVTDAALNRVVLFSLDGTYLDAFGKRGSGAKEFKEPLGIAVYEKLIFVADSGNRRIQIFGPNGVYLKSIGPTILEQSEASKKAELEKQETDEKDEQLKLILMIKSAKKEKKRLQTIHLEKPRDVVVDHRGRVYIVDSGSGSVRICNLAGEYLGKLPEVKAPRTIVKALDGLYLSDGDLLSIAKYNFEHQQVYSFGLKGEGQGLFGSISDFAVDAEGKVYIADSAKGFIHIYQTGKGTLPPSEAITPAPDSARWLKDIPIKARSIAYAGADTLYAVDGRNLFRVKNGAVTRLRTPKEAAPGAIAVDKDGSLWVLDEEHKRVIKLDSDGRLINTVELSSDKMTKWFSKPRDLVVTSRGVVYVADPGNKWVWVKSISKDNMVISRAIRRDHQGNDLQNPVALTLDEDDNLYVLEGQRARIHVYSPEGKPIRSFGNKGKTGLGMSKPIDLFVANGKVFVLDSEQACVKVFNEDGTFLRQFGTEGNGHGDFLKPVAIAAKDDISFFVADPENARVQVLSNVYTPDIPDEIRATGGMHHVGITWGKNLERYPLAYNIYRSDSEAGPFSFVVTTRENRFIDRGVDPGKTYFYKVSALADGGNESSPSQQSGATPLKYAPKSPQGLTAKASEWSVTLSWNPSEENFVTQYAVYRQAGDQNFELERVKKTSFTDQPLAPNTVYTYRVKAVSSDGEESPASVIAIKTKIAKTAPVEIEVVRIDDIFSNAYKIYEDEGFGQIRLRNNTGDVIANLKLSFRIKEFMDFASEIEVVNLPPGKTKEVTLKAVFNNKILDVTEDSALQTEIKASYYLNDELQEFTRNHAINIYEKHRMMWNNPERFATFMTPKDPVLLEFVRSVVTQFGKVESKIQRAAIVFNALGVMGLTYLPDPNNPYQITSEKVDFVDYLQYPREVLKRKSGDCDDLVALYASALESMGINTKAVEIPGHMLMMFSAGTTAGEIGDTMNNLFVIHNERLWVPLETTLVGSSFMKAWEKGSSSYYQWIDKGLSTIDPRKAWKRFKPASLPATAWRPDPIKHTVIDQRYPGELASIKRIELKLQARKYYDRLTRQPGDTDALMQIGIIYGRAGLAEEALKAFDRILKKEKANSAALNNKANVLYLNKQYREAIQFYQKAGEVAPRDAMIWVNLARSHLKVNAVKKAQAAFRKAYDIDSKVSLKFRTMALELLNTL